MTLGALTTVTLLILVVIGFIRGLEASLGVSVDPSVMLVYSINAEENIENSSIAARTPELLSASLEAIQQQFGIKYVSPELFLGTRIQTHQTEKTGLGLVRGVTSSAPLVRRRVQLTEGHWPGPGEVMVGKLVAAKLGCDQRDLAIGQNVSFEKTTWRISGKFSAGGSSFESEIWCPLSDFQQKLKRQDISLVAVLLRPEGDFSTIEMFCKERTDLELQAVRETTYFASLQKHYQPIRTLAWMVVVLISGSGVFAGLNMMYGAVAGRVQEIATLQAVGYRRRAILLSLIQEGTLLATTGSLLSALFALSIINGLAVRFTMGAFELRVDGTAVMIGSGVGLLLGVFGAIPPAVKVLRLPIAQSLKSV